MRLLFCVPAYGSTVRVETMNSVAVGMMHLTNAFPGIEIRLFIIDMAEIARVRNLFASMALQEEFDAVIMIDADMGIPPEVFPRLLASGYDVCGMTYPKRKIDLERFHQLAAEGHPFDIAHMGALEFISAGAIVQVGGEVKIENGFVEMGELPGGCLLIRGAALKKLWREMPDIRQLKHVNDIEARMGVTKLLRCFDNLTENGTKVSEDLSFCRRWKSLGGKIYGLIDAPIAHYGSMKFEGRFMDLLMANATRVRQGQS
jgi:hypothetical protein